MKKKDELYWKLRGIRNKVMLYIDRNIVWIGMLVGIAFTSLLIVGATLLTNEAVAKRNADTAAAARECARVSGAWTRINESVFICIEKAGR